MGADSRAQCGGIRLSEPLQHTLPAVSDAPSAIKRPVPEERFKGPPTLEVFPLHLLKTFLERLKIAYGKLVSIGHQRGTTINRSRIGGGVTIKAHVVLREGARVFGDDQMRRQAFGVQHDHLVTIVKHHLQLKVGASHNGVDSGAARKRANRRLNSGFA